ncbi:MAG: PAS domain-containing protein, partial [Syntrophales bacterium]|nr:PAS domain-containing protein [Syntrophales bacterium]
KARAGAYPANIAADVSAERLRRFFVEEDHGYRVGKEIREMVVFAPQNVIMDPPFTKLDILICRNLLIYLASELQKKLFPLFHYSLNPGGCLFLGSAETIGSFTDLFVSLDVKARIYRRLETAIGAEPVEFPASFFPVAPGIPEKPSRQKPAPNLQSLADQLLLTRFAPAAVLTSDKGDILYISGRTGKYLEPAAGKANWNIIVMAREGIRYELSNGFQKALRQQETIILKGLAVRSDGGMQGVNITIEPIREPAALRGMVMIVFADAVVPPEKAVSGAVKRTTATGARLLAMEEELRQARAEAQVNHEEMQTSQEELKSANEELQSTNEELQSTNEELTTSKEEMQSLNEELQTVNQELQAKVEELSRTNNDMQNLFDSTEIAALFLDDMLRVRRFTSRTAKIIKLIPGDVGRPITDIASDLLYPELIDDIQDVLRSLVFVEKQVVTRHGKWFSVRIMPYRTLEKRIDGVVITLTDITAAKELERELRKAKGELEGRLDTRTTELAKSREDLKTEIDQHTRKRKKAPAKAHSHETKETTA